jgi:hypothetical protein
MSRTRQPTVEREYHNSTADLTLSANDCGKTFGNVGASGTVIFTLPAAATAPMGGDIKFLACADQTLTVSGTAGELIALNDIAANTASLQTSSEKAGGAIVATAVGSGTVPTKWHLSFQTEETQTVTVTT